MTAPRFTLADLLAARDAWSCSCGPASLAAICGLTLDEVRPHFGPDWPGYTNVRAMRLAIHRAGRTYHDHPRHQTAWPRYGLARIQWEGPWTAPGANPRWSYRHTHWVGVSRLQLASGVVVDPDAVYIWDCNATDIGGGWSPLAWWSSRVAPRLTREIQRATGGWHITHAIEVSR